MLQHARSAEAGRVRAGAVCAASEESFTPSITDLSPEPSLRSGRADHVEDDGNGDYEEAGPALAAVNAMPPTSVNGSASSSSSSSASSSSLHGGFQLQGKLSRSAKSRPTTIEIVIPARPEGWEDVSLVRCVESSDDGEGEHPSRKQLSAGKKLDEPKAGDVARLFNRSTHFSPRMKGSTKIHLDMATSPSNRSRKYTEASEAFDRRRNAISEMHACIQEHRKSHLKKAAVLSR